MLLIIVMAMVNNGHGLAVMGNHEFNALAFHTLNEGEYLRKHTDNNIRLHKAFLNEFENDDRSIQEVLAFFYQLPLFLELDGFRVIHACWDTRYINYIKSRTTENKLTPELLVRACTKGDFMCEAISTVLNGLEVALPDNNTFRYKDASGHGSIRVQWWNRNAKTLGDVLPVGLATGLGNASNCLLPNDFFCYGENELPCFIGHYWMKGEPEPLVDNVACVDYSVAKDGKLVAYRWSGEGVLLKSHFCYFKE